MVQPGVSALGKKKRTTLFPRKSFNDTSLPFSSGKVNSGALSLVFMGTPVRTWLYRKAGWAVIWVAALTIIPVSSAQYAKKNTQSKGPRALGILEFLPNGKARLRPICIMVDGRFYDAGVYKADPVPMALDKGIVYEAERAGVSQGLFNINDVLENKQQSFIAEGSFMPAGAEEPKSGAIKAENKPKEDEEDKPPVLRRPGTESAKPQSAPADNKTAQTHPAQNTPNPENTPPKDDEDSDRPRLKKPQGEQPSPAATIPSQSTVPAGNDQTASSSPDENDPNRPQLRRGKPQPYPSASAQPAAKPATPGAQKSASSKPEPAKPEHQIMAAISDADGPEPRPYTYDATPKEKEAFRAKVLKLAAQELASKARELEPGLKLPSTRVVRTGKGTTKAVANETVWDDVDFQVFDVATSNEPILIVSAKGHFPPATQLSGKSRDETTPIEFYVTTVAHSDLYGELRSLFSAVTDDRTLDVTPKYQLVDVVDADGDGRGELLFRQTSDQGTSYAVYRVGADRLWPLYEGTPAGQ